MAPRLLYAHPKGDSVSAHRPPVLDGMRVLVVEDVWDILEVFSILLRAEGAQVAAAGTGREAADLVRQGDFDVVLTDLGLPDIPGDVLIRQIRSSGTRRSRVVAVTGFGEPYISRALQAGADVVFTKPVEWSRILEYLSRPDLAASA
jgi:two-component system, chemotaxis family, CheB/CheR fusion protein